jgi:hypothetical protein
MVAGRRDAPFTSDDIEVVEVKKIEALKEVGRQRAPRAFVSRDARRTRNQILIKPIAAIEKFGG